MTGTIGIRVQRRVIWLYPNVAYLRRGKTRQGASDVASHRLGQVEAYFTVREVLPEASKGADGVHWCEFSGFGRFRFATLGLNHLLPVAPYTGYRSYRHRTDADPEAP